MSADVEALFIADQLRKFRDIRQRLEAALVQLSDQEVNWRPNAQSNSVANLVVHVCGNLVQRFGHNLEGAQDVRMARAAEFDEELARTGPELLDLIARTWDQVEGALGRLAPERLTQEYIVRDRPITVLHLVAQTSAHASEHLGQILYIAKLVRGEAYRVVWP